MCMDECESIPRLILFPFFLDATCTAIKTCVYGNCINGSCR